MTAKDGNTLHGIGRINTGNRELQPQSSATFRISHLIRKLSHNKDTLTLRLTIDRKTTIDLMIESITLIGYLNIETTATGAHSQRHRF